MFAMSFTTRNTEAIAAVMDYFKSVQPRSESALTTLLMTLLEQDHEAFEMACQLFTKNQNRVQIQNSPRLQVTFMTPKEVEINIFASGQDWGLAIYFKRRATVLPQQILASLRAIVGHDILIYADFSGGGYWSQSTIFGEKIKK